MVAGFVIMVIEFCRNYSSEKKSRLTGILLVLAAIVIWSFVPVGTRLLMQHGGAFSAAFISAARLWVAAAFFMGLRAWHIRGTGERFFTPITHRGWLLAAAAGISLNYLLYSIGLHYTTAGVTSVASQVSPIVTVLLAAWLLGEVLTRQKIIGMVLASTGILLVIFEGNSFSNLFSSSYLHGNLIEIVAALAWPFYAIGQAKLLEEDHTQQILMPIFLLAAILSAFFLPLTGPLVLHLPSLTDWLVIFFLGAGCTGAAYWLFTAGLLRIETSEGAMFNVLIPFLAIIMAWLVLGEHIRIGVIMGLVLVISGLALIVWRRSRTGKRRVVGAKSPQSSCLESNEQHSKHKHNNRINNHNMPIPKVK